MKSYLDLTTVLTFESKDERDEHPLAGLIPNSLWIHADLFNKQLTPFSIKHLNGHPKTLVEDFSFTGKDQNKMLIWVCNALANPQAIDDLNELAKVLKLKREDTFSMACHIGNIPMIAFMLKDKSNEEKLALIEQGNYSAYRGAIENPKPEVVAYLEKQIPGLVQKLKEDNFKKTFFILESALQQGQLAVFHYLEGKNPEQNVLVSMRDTHHGSRHNDFHHLLCLASQKGYLEIMDRFSAPTDQIELDSYAVIRAAADGGQEKVLDYFKQIYHTLTLNLDKYYNYKEIFKTYSQCAQDGKLQDLLSFEKQEEPLFIEEVDKANEYEVFRQAADNDHGLVVNHLLSNNEDCRNYAATKNQYAPLILTYEAENTKLKTLQDLIAQLKTYGEALSAPNQNDTDKAEGEKTVTVANTLQNAVEEFTKARKVGDLEAEQRAQQTFKDEWQKGYKELGAHRTPIRSILAEIAIAATIVGLFAIAIKYLLTGSTFFSQTKRQEQANEIDSAFDALYSVHPK
jgi:hypothetical protein